MGVCALAEAGNGLDRETVKAASESEIVGKIDVLGFKHREGAARRPPLIDANHRRCVLADHDDNRRCLSTLIGAIGRDCPQIRLQVRIVHRPGDRDTIRQVCICA